MRLFAARRPVAGFTLIEMLVGLLLLSLLVAGAWGGIHTAVKAIHSGNNAIERTNRLRVTQQFLRRQLSHAMPIAFTFDKGTGEGWMFKGGPQTMRFVAPMPGYLSRGGLYVQTLELSQAADGIRLSFDFHMLSGSFEDPPRDAGRDPTKLIGHIRQARFMYRGLNEQGQLGEWKANWDEPQKTPVMVAIDLSMAPRSGMHWPKMVIPLMMDVGSLPRGARRRLMRRALEGAGGRQPGRAATPRAPGRSQRR